MEKILISACLLGEKVRYDGGDKKIEDNLISQWQEEGRIITICPEMAGGLPTPRLPAEGVNDRIIDNTGNDVTEHFIKGAKLTLQLAQKHNIRIAILKEHSPSCGSNEIYDGSFSGKTIKGMGVTAQHLTENGVKVFSENNLNGALEYLKTLD